jgi:hypothetical protein
MALMSDGYLIHLYLVEKKLYYKVCHNLNVEFVLISTGCKVTEFPYTKILTEGFHFYLVAIFLVSEGVTVFSFEATCIA